MERHAHGPEYIFQDAPHPEVIEHQVVQAMQRAGVEPALIYAYEQTRGLMLNAHNIQKVPDKDIAEGEAAIDEYERKTGNKASRRLLTKTLRGSWGTRRGAKRASLSRPDDPACIATRYEQNGGRIWTTYQ